MSFDRVPHRARLVLALGCAALAASAGAATLRAKIVDESGAPVSGAVVVAVPASAGALPAPKPATVEQIDAEFVPTVTAVQVGAAVSFPNRDNVQHHVYSFSPAKPFELPLYKGAPSSPVVFDKPGIVVLGCNIHDWMRGYVYVSESPWFGTSSAEGTVAIANMPPGTYAVRAWHPRLAAGEDTTQRSVEVSAATPELSWQLKLKPDSRPRRAPGAGSHGYH